MAPPSAPCVFVLNAFADEGEMYAEYLRAHGFTVQVYRDPSEVLREASRRPPDLIVTRLRQAHADLTGIDVVRRLKQASRTRHVRTVMITTSILPSDETAASEADCDLYLLLPLLPDQLVAEIRRLLAPEQPRQP